MRPSATDSRCFTTLSWMGSLSMWLPTSRQALSVQTGHIENAIAIAILKRADRPAANRHFETKAPPSLGFNSNLLNGVFEEALRLPYGNVHDIFPGVRDQSAGIHRRQARALCRVDWWPPAGANCRVPLGR